MLSFITFCQPVLSADMLDFANSLDPDQARRNVQSDLGPNCLTLMVFEKELFEKIDFEKNQKTTKKHAKLPSI